MVYSRPVVADACRALLRGFVRRWCSGNNCATRTYFRSTVLIWPIGSVWCSHGWRTETSFNSRGRTRRSIAFDWYVVVINPQAGISTNNPQQLIDVANGLGYLHRAGVAHGNLRGVCHLTAHDINGIDVETVCSLTYSSAIVVRHEPFCRIMALRQSFSTPSL